MTFHPTQNPLFWKETADACFAGERYEKAAEAYLRLAELMPNDAEAWKGRGAALIKLGRFAEAADCLERALMILPDDEILLALLSEALNCLGDAERKTACFVRIGELVAEKKD